MYRITIQCVAEHVFVPKISALREWAKAALRGRVAAAELTIRIIDRDEMTTLNETYRHKKGPTNVLSFPFENDFNHGQRVPSLGDIAICAEVVNAEALAQHKTALSHWAHMVVHGVLHLLGYDHQEKSDADKMEHEEILLLQNFGFNNPYDLGPTP